MRRDAAAPCTRTSTTDNWNPSPLDSSSCRKSCQAAVPTLVTAPTGMPGGYGDWRPLTPNPPVTTAWPVLTAASFGMPDICSWPGVMDDSSPK